MLAFVVNTVTAVLAILAATALRFILVDLNKKLERGEEAEAASVTVEGGVPGEAAKKGFRFLY